MTTDLLDVPEPGAEGDPGTAEVSKPDADLEVDDRGLVAGRWSLRSDRTAAVAFGAFLAASFVVLVFWVGKDRWFFRDEWAFLAGRELTDLGDLFRSHNGHWSTLPIIVFRLLFKVVGLRAYWPYLAGVVALHLTAAALMRLVMRRAGVGPWLASIAAGVFVFFGSGEENILWAFQIGFVGALVCGLAQLLLADQPNSSFNRRDLVGLGFGLAGLMCSGLAPVMVAAVGLAVLLRRGWRLALAHTVPLGIIYGTWLVLSKPESNGLGRPTFAVGVSWVRASVTGTFLDLGQSTPVAIGLGVIMVVGLALAWIPLDWTSFRRLAPGPLALLFAAVAFFTSVATERWIMGENFAVSSRYVYTGAALMLPAVGVGAAAICRRWNLATPVVVVILLLGVPGNVAAFNSSSFSPGYFKSEREMYLSLASSPLASQVPRDLRPDPDVFGSVFVTMGWLRDVDKAGKAPDPPETISNGYRKSYLVRMGVEQSIGEAPTNCTTYREPLRLHPKEGTVFGITGPVRISTFNKAEKADSIPINFQTNGGRVLTVVLPDLSLQFNVPDGASSFELCT